MRILKGIVISSTLIFISVVIYLIYQNKMYGYTLDLKRFKDYTWIFKESFLKDMDTVAGSWVGNQNTLTTFAYKRDLANQTTGLVVDIWEFEKHNEIDIKKIDFENCFIDDNIPSDERIILYSGSPLERVTKRNVQFRTGLKIKLDLVDTIMHKYNSLNYNGVYGDINTINVYNQHGLQIKFKNEFENKRTIFLLYKKKKSLYFILVRSEKKFDMNIIDSLNLN